MAALTSTISPSSSARRGCCDLDDGVAIGGDALAMEGRRGKLALPHVDGIVGGDQAFAQQDLHALQGAFLDEGGAWLIRISRMYSGWLTKMMSVPMNR